MDNRIKKLKKYISGLDPEKIGVSNFNTKQISIEEISRGGYNINYLVILNKDKFVFRLNIDNYLDVENQTKYEYEILNLLDNKNIAPKVYFLDISRNKLKSDLLIEEFIENDKLEFGEDFLHNIGKLVKKLHETKLPEKNILIKRVNPLYDQWQFIKNLINYINSQNFYPDFISFINTYISKIDNYINKHSSKFIKNDICLNHRDLIIENILQTKNGLRLVDWQAAMVDDPSYDLAFFINDVVIEWNLNRSLTEKEKRIFLDSYGVNSSELEKIEIRTPVIYLELFVWIAYRASFLRNKLQSNLVENCDKDFVKNRIRAYEKFLDNNKVKKYLEIFK